MGPRQTQQGVLLAGTQCRDGFFFFFMAFIAFMALAVFMAFIAFIAFGMI